LADKLSTIATYYFFNDDTGVGNAEIDWFGTQNQVAYDWVHAVLES